MTNVSLFRAIELVLIFTGFIAATYGFGIYLFPALAPEMIKDIGFSYNQMGVTTGLVQAAFMLFALISGLITARFGAFRIIQLSSYTCLLCLAGLFFADNFIIISALLILMGGCAASVWVPMVEVSQQVIKPQHQGKAFGLMSSGTSYGVFINSLLIAYILPVYGWKLMWAITALIVLVLCIYSSFRLRSYNKPTVINTNENVIVSSSTVSLKDRILSLPRMTTIAILLMMFLNGMSCIPYQTYLSSFLVNDRGLDVETSAYVWSIIGITGMVGGFLMGWLADKITVRWALFFTYLILTASTYTLLFVDIDKISLFAMAVSFGLAFYAIFGLVPAYISKVYKNQTAALVFSFGNIALGCGGLIGNVLGGVFKANTGNFEYIYLLIIAAAIGSAILSIFMKSENSFEERSALLT